jgi:hypothetical protein
MPSLQFKGKEDHFIDVSKMIPVGSGAECEIDDVMLTRHALPPVEAKVRQTIKELGGTMPENLPVAEDIKKLQTPKRKKLPGK